MMAPLGRRSRTVRRRAARHGQLPTVAAVAGSLPRTAARGSASVGPSWIASVERFAQLPVGDEPAHVWTNAKSYAVRSARALRAAKRTDGHFNTREPSTRRGQKETNY